MKMIEVEKEDLRKLLIIARVRQDELKHVQPEDPGYEKALQFDKMVELLKRKYAYQLHI